MHIEKLRLAEVVNRIRPVATICTPSNRGFLGPTRVKTRNGTSIGLAVFGGLTIVTDLPTDGQTCTLLPSVTIGRIYVRSTAMRPNNNA